MRYLLAVAVTLAALPALAADASADPSPFVQYLLVPILAALGLVVSAAGAYGAALLRAKASSAGSDAKSKLVAVAAEKTLRIVSSVVAKVWADLRVPMEAAAADGVLTTEEKAQLRAKALELALAALGEAGKAELMGVLGLSEAGVPTYVAGLLEQAMPGVAASRAHADASIAVSKADAAKAAAEQAASEAKVQTGAELLAAARTTP